MTVGEYLAQRLEELGLTDFFAIPGDFNLALLDEMLKHPRLRMINCCNELNMGYAADGYARERGVAAMVLTFAVGGLSAINAVAGAYAENLPVIVISGGPNLDSLARNRIIHHTRAKPQEGEHCVRMVYQAIAAHAVVIRDAATAAFHIDEAIRIAMTLRKPVYIEVACNLANAPISQPHPLVLAPAAASDPKALAAALEHAAGFLNQARSPVLVAGGKLRDAAREAFGALAHACGYGVACMPNAKSFFPEEDPQFMGIYWGNVSSPGCREIVESSDAYLFAAPVFSDYTTVGFSALVRSARLIDASLDRILIAGQSYHGINLAEFLAQLAPRLQVNGAALAAYGQIREAPAPPPAATAETMALPLTTRRLFHHIGALLDPRTTVLAETGDSWFNGMDLRLPDGCRFEIQMQYGSIGWSVGACLGLMVANPGRRVLGLIGDGSFQMGAQEVSTMLRYRCPGILFLLNNGGYTIEVKIHDGPYNGLQPWKYAQLIEVFKDQAPAQGWVVRTEAELVAALATARTFPGLAFIEAILDPKDCNKALLAWGTAVAEYNGQRDPNSG